MLLRAFGCQRYLENPGRSRCQAPQSPSPHKSSSRITAKGEPEAKILYGAPSPTTRPEWSKRPQRSRPQGHSLCRIQNTKLKSETRRTIPHNEVIKYVPWLLSRVHARTKRIAQQTQVRADHRILNRLFIFCSSEQVNPHSRRAEVFRR